MYPLVLCKENWRTKLREAPFSLCPWEGPWEMLKQMPEECEVRLNERMWVFVAFILDSFFWGLIWKFREDALEYYDINQNMGIM